MIVCYGLHRNLLKAQLLLEKVIPSPRWPSPPRCQCLIASGSRADRRATGALARSGANAPTRVSPEARLRLTPDLWRLCARTSARGRPVPPRRPLDRHQPYGFLRPPIVPSPASWRNPPDCRPYFWFMSHGGHPVAGTPNPGPLYSRQTTGFDSTLPASLYAKQSIVYASRTIGRFPGPGKFRMLFAEQPPFGPPGVCRCRRDRSRSGFPSDRGTDRDRFLIPSGCNGSVRNLSRVCYRFTTKPT